MAVLAACSSPPDQTAGGMSAYTGDGGPRVAPAPDADLPDADSRLLPDLTVDRDRMISDLTVQVVDFAADACELDPQEDCIGGPGERTLLRFAVETPNIGTDDLVLGMPTDDNDNFEYSSCHDHYHFRGYAEFRLVDAAGDDVAVGHKQAFCLLDSEPYLTDDPTVGTVARYWCGFQGIQRGWSDVYHTGLPCQFIDITDTPPGTYTLRVELNSERRLEELRYDNNLAEVDVTVGDPALEVPTEACDPGLSPRSVGQIDRECGWTPAETFDCTPGQLYRVGCSACAGIGSCTGDPMLRVCDPAAAGDNCSHPARILENQDACDACPRVRDLECPASGRLAVYSAAREVGTSYTCALELQAQ